MDPLNHFFGLFLALATSIGSSATGTVISSGIISTEIAITGSLYTQETGISLLRYDESAIQQQRLSWINTERLLVGRVPYLLDHRLNKTAQTRADTLKLRGSTKTSTIHERTAGDGFYNYGKILQRFRDQETVFITKSTVTEIIGRGVVSCKKALVREQCIQRIIDATNTTLGFFLGEKKANGSHYRAIASKSFDRMGVGVAIDWDSGKYRFVSHVSGPIK